MARPSLCEVRLERGEEGDVYAENFKARSSIILRQGSLRGSGRSLRRRSLRQSSGGDAWGRGGGSRLLKRVFRVDVSLCLRCWNDLEIVSVVRDGEGVARYLDRVGMGRDPPDFVDAEKRMGKS